MTTGHAACWATRWLTEPSRTSANPCSPSPCAASKRDGLVTRTVHPVVPPRVDYILTDLGHSLSATIVDLVQWAERNRPHIDNARKIYDQQQSAERAN